MAGSDPTASVNLYSNSQPEKNKLQEKQCHVVNIPEDESTPFHRPELEAATLSKDSLLSITKTIRQQAVAAAFLIFAVLFNLTILSVIHERVPLDKPPLPDVAFSLMPKNDRALDISEYIIMFMTTSILLMTLLHRYRSIVFRRLCFIMAILYLLRALCMAVTQLPVANPQYYCSPQLNLTDNFEWWNFTKILVSRVSHMSLGMGLSVNGRHSFCGDYIFSGHTIMLVITYLFLNEYWLSTRLSIPWRLIKCTYFLLVCTGIVCILVARGHYTVDIVIAYILSSRIFFIYHCACDNALLPNQSTRYKQIWWHTLFTYVESDTIKNHIVVQNVFEVSELFSFRFQKR